MLDRVKKARIGDKLFSVQSLGPDDSFYHVISDGYGNELYSFAKDQLQGDAVVLDIGANIGLTSCILSQLAATVHSFEPQPEVFALLKANVEGNGLSNVMPWNFAVSSTPGVAHFAGFSAYGSISDDVSAPEVSVVTIDGFVEEHGLQRVDFIKVDVEGFEPHVLEGARNTIEKFNPIIYMEFNSWCLMRNGKTNPLDFAKTLFKDFASVYVIDSSDQGFSVRHSPEQVLHDNVVRSGSVDDLILLKRPRPLHTTSRELERMKSHIESVSAELRDALERESALHRELEDSQAECQAYRNSSSWRITTPMRAIKGILGR